MSIPNPIDQIKKDLHTLDYFDALVQQYLLDTLGVATDWYGVPAAVTDIHYDGGTYVELTSTFCYLGREFTLHIIRNEESFKVTVEGEEDEYEVTDTGRLAKEILDFFFDYEDTIKEVLPHFVPAEFKPRTVVGDNIVYTGTYRGNDMTVTVDPAGNTWYARIGDDRVTDSCDVGSQKIFYQAEKIVDHIDRPRFPGCSPRTGKTYVNDIRHLLEPANVVFVLEDTEFDPENQSLTYHGTIDGVGATFAIVENVPMEVSVTFFTDDGGIVGDERVTGRTRKAHMDAIPALVTRTKAANEAIAARKSARIKDLPEKKTPLTLEERIARLEKIHNLD